MKRRTFLLGSSGLIAASGALFGTQAFSQATATRSSEIPITTDATAGVGLIPGEDVEAAFINEKNELEIDTGRGTGEGMNPNSEYWIGGRVSDDEVTLGDLEANHLSAGDLEYPMLTIRNQTVDVRLFKIVFTLGPVVDDLTMYVLSWSDELDYDPTVEKLGPSETFDGSWEFEMGPAEVFHLALVFDVGTDPDPLEFSGDLTVNAHRKDD